MDYSRLLEEKDRLLPEAGEKERQAAMERGIRSAVEGETAAPRIHDQMKKSFVSCSEKDGTVTLSYEVEEWELNPMDTMHGGMIAAAIDTTCGITVRYTSGKLKTPTVSMTVNYLSPVPLGEHLLVTARAVKVGRRVANMTAEAVLEKSGRTAATATAVFFVGE